MAQKYEDLAISQFGNTGYETQAVTPDEIVGLIFADRSMTFTAANIASDTAFIAAMQPKTYALPFTSRIYPLLGVNVIDAITDSTADATAETGDYGNTRGIKYGNHTFKFTLTNNGIYLFQQLSKLVNNKSLSVALVDKQGFMYGRKNGTGAKYMPCKAWVEQPKMATGTAASLTTLNVVLQEEDAFLNSDKLFIYPFAKSVILSDLMHGVHDVRLIGGTHTATTGVIRAEIAANFKSMGVDYGTALAAAGAWIVKKKSDGSTVTPSGVTYSSVTEQFTIAGLTTATTYIASLATPSALIALSVGDAATGAFESNTIEFTTL